jgi:hypothetical protein
MAPADAPRGLVGTIRTLYGVALRDPIAGLRGIFDHLPEGGRAPAVDHTLRTRPPCSGSPAGRSDPSPKEPACFVMEADNARLEPVT